GLALALLMSCHSGQDGGPPRKAQEPARVEVAAVEPGALDDTWTYLGTARARASAQMAAGASGEVAAVRVWEGDRVAQGDVLVALDTSLVTAKMRSAKASRSRSAALLAQAKRDRERSERLGSSIVPRAEIERDRSSAEALSAEVRSLKASASEVEVELDRHRVAAPFDGVVTARLVDPGDWVEPGQTVIEVVAVRDVEVVVDVDPALLEYTSAGAPAVIRAPEAAILDGDAHAGARTVNAEVAGIVPTLDRVTRTAKIRLRPADVSPWLLPGAAVKVDFPVARRGVGVVVPRDALVIGPTETRVIRAAAGKAEPVVVEVLATAGGQALVEPVGEATLAQGEQVVVRGNERLRPGQALAIVTSTLAAPQGVAQAEVGP
ncbi:MAG: efflux RND transporter periplasmic adaptor subunit, partial [Myxococcales bacterium]|nr:efflux RND transporter periplasmic adaptor subunit [Myxococcales bacterium]